jgi:hypothetical protein
VFDPLTQTHIYHSRSLLKKAHLFCDIIERQARDSYAPVCIQPGFSQLAGLTNRGHALRYTRVRADALMEMMTADISYTFSGHPQKSISLWLILRGPLSVFDRDVVELVFTAPDLAPKSRGLWCY